MSFFLAPLDELAQLLRAGDPLHHLHDLNLAGLHTGLDVGLLLVLLLFGLFLFHCFSSIYAFFC